jgi:hypothetical protein
MEATKGKHSIGGFSMYGGIGAASVDPASFSSINTALQVNGFAASPSDFVSWNIAPMNFFVRNTVFGFEMNGLAKRNNAIATSRTTASGMFTKLYFGYIVMKGKHSLFYPEIGASIGHTDVHSHEGSDPVNDVSATNHFAAVDISLNFDRFSNIIEDKHSILQTNATPGKLFCSELGLSVGYIYSPVSTYWNDNNIDIYNKNSSNVNFVTDVVGNNNSSAISMFYVKLKLGFGMMWKN